MAKRGATKLIKGSMFLTYGVQGWSENFMLPDPNVTDPIEAAAATFGELCRFRAGLLPEGVVLKKAIVSYLGKPSDSINVLASRLTGIQSGSPAVYKFTNPNDPWSCVSYRLQSENGGARTLWIRGISDDLILDTRGNFSATAILQKPPSCPPTPRRPTCSAPCWTSTFRRF
jgi:hypothetical protein